MRAWAVLAVALTGCSTDTFGPGDSGTDAPSPMDGSDAVITDGIVVDPPCSFDGGIDIPNGCDMSGGCTGMNGCCVDPEAGTGVCGNCTQNFPQLHCYRASDCMGQTCCLVPDGIPFGKCPKQLGPSASTYCKSGCPMSEIQVCVTNADCTGILKCKTVSNGALTIGGCLP
jgi:hypothetical protein